MTDSARAFAVFDEALGLEIHEQRKFLDKACASDPALRAEVEALLAADLASEGFLTPISTTPRDRSGEQVGPWRLGRELGHGGMGTVYLAEPADDLDARKVALKLLRFDAGDLRVRFANERRILATLEHPNIARLLDAGTDAGGAPYVAMEYVEGVPITRWCDARTLDVRDRVLIFLKVLDAVQSAHGRLIVHRDLKPANILVDGQGEPKLLDFGIAKLIDTDTRGLTLTGFAPLTPEYASPEQVRGEPIGTASDIYALGVLLYELCVGERPYRFISGTPAEIERIVCNAPPPRPSARLQTDRRRRIDPDIDHVILKAMAKSPGDRYASCAQFADDLRRYLGGQPVLATHAGWRYRANKFVRRHRAPVALALLIALALTASAVTALTQARAAREQARIARAERDNAERVNAFLQAMLAAADPADLGRKATVADVLDRAQHSAERALVAEPATLVATELTLAKTYTALGDLDAARQSGVVALATARKLGDPASTIDAQLGLSSALVARGDFAGAATLLGDARRAAIAVGSARQRGNAANQLGLLEDARGNPAKAQTWIETALDELPADATDARAEAMNDLAIIKGTRSDFAGALTLQQKSVDLLRAAYPNANPQLAQALSNLAVSLDDNGQRAAASAAYEQALAMKIDLLGENHPDVVMTLGSLTYHDVVGKNVAAALAHGARAWAAAQTLSADHPAMGYVANTYSQALLLAGRPKEAIPLLEISLRVRKARYPADHPLVVNTESVLGLARAQSGDLAGGEALAHSAYDRQLAKLGPTHEMTIAARDRLAQIESLVTSDSPAQR